MENSLGHACAGFHLTGWKQLERQELLMAGLRSADEEPVSIHLQKIHSNPVILFVLFSLLYSYYLWMLSSKNLSSPAHASRALSFLPTLNPLCFSLHSSFLSPLPFHTSITAFLPPPLPPPCSLASGFCERGLYQRG